MMVGTRRKQASRLHSGLNPGAWSIAVLGLAALLVVSCATVPEIAGPLKTAAAQHQDYPARRLENAARPAERPTVFQTGATVYTGCVAVRPNRPDRLPGVQGDRIAFSGLAKVFELPRDVYVYVKDTKMCHWGDGPRNNEYFGIISQRNRKLLAWQVALDVGAFRHPPTVRQSPGFPDVHPLSPPTDLEAVCVVSRQPDQQGFTALAVESGGFAPQAYRRLFKVDFRVDSAVDDSDRSPWTAKISGMVNYHSAIDEPLPANFEVEGILCLPRDEPNAYTVILADRGRHQRDGSGHNGGLLMLDVDFDRQEVSHALPGFSNIAGAYIHVQAPRPDCAFQETAEEDGDQAWRDISDLYSDGARVWAASTYEDEANETYCSKIYTLCQSSDCSDLGVGDLSVTVRPVPDFKVEGLAAPISRERQNVQIAIATDEEAQGRISLRQEICAQPDCRTPLSPESSQ